MAIPTGSDRVVYRLGVTDINGEVFNDQREFNLADGISTQVWSAQDTNDQVEVMMDNYLDTINTTYPASAGYTVNASRDYKAQGLTGDTWPTP